MNSKYIDLLETIKKDIMRPAYHLPVLDDIIKRLQMWEELKSKYGTFFRDTEEGRCLGEMMSLMEYQNFPSKEEHPTPLEELKLQAKVFNDVLDGEVNKGYPRINFRRDNALLTLYNELPTIIEDIYKKLEGVIK